ncbi:hypothetical protein LCGC14_3115770 [marine sediment metagenome]|uniref:Uncharacterized protein n=1 Tax=marine sediment metagenome TaxID=412755 RepID=A0A0F8WSS0_9ZZZZ
MTVLVIPISTKKYIGLSTDTKPTIATPNSLPPPPIGSTFLEHDTGILYITHDGTTWVVKDNTQKASPVITPTTGVDTALATLDPASDFKLLGIRIFMGSALASGETITVTLDANEGPEYDIVLRTLDMGTPDIRSVMFHFGEGEDNFVSGDKIVVALSANTGSDTWGCETIHELR